MKPLLRSFGMLLRQITKDSMLYAVLVAPLLAGCLFRFGIPRIEAALCAYFGQASILGSYYLLFDLFLAVLTPYMFCFASSMVLLTEYDENMAAYMAVTPVGKRGYITSRLLFPAVASFFVSAAILPFFSLTVWSLPRLLLVCALTALLSITESLMVVSFSRNRVEGMAVAKLTGIVMLGLPVPFFLFSGTQYLFAPLPSFWIAKLFVDDNDLMIVPAVIISMGWIWGLYRKFEGKVS